MQRTIKITTLLLSSTLTGCAYLTNYTQPVNLASGSVSIDVKQRVVFSQKRETNVVVCAEPSPDALTVIGASGGLSITNETSKTANLSGALSESGASIGLRTQSIQLLRDAMYRLCEGYAGGAVSEADFSAMQRRYQSTMMGLIAIEQLTGPIVASQALLMSSVGSQSGASLGDAAVDAAKSSLDLTSDAVLEAEKDLDSAKTALSTTREGISASEEIVRAEQAKKDAKKDFDQTVIDAQRSRMTGLLAQEKLDVNAVADKQRRLEEKKKRQTVAEADLRAAKAKVRADAGGAGRLGDVAGSTRASNEAFANAVTEIVSEINRSYSRDSCLALVTELVKSSPQRLILASPSASASTPKVAKLEEDAENVLKKLRSLREAKITVIEYLERAKTAGDIEKVINHQTDLDGVQRRIDDMEKEHSVLISQIRELTAREASPNVVLQTGLAVCQEILRLDAEASKRLSRSEVSVPMAPPALK